MSEDFDPEVGDIVSQSQLIQAGFTNEQAATIYDAMKGTRAAVMANRLAMKEESRKQREQMQKIQDMVMILMETTRALQIALQLSAMAEMESPLEPWKVGTGIAMLAIVSGLDAYYMSKLVSS